MSKILLKYIRKLFIITFCLIFNIFIIKNYIKVCLCTIGKNENKYIREYIEHYKNYGVDKIFIYDNNEIDGENFEEVISDYINKGFVEIINFRGERSPQIKIFNDCHKKNYKNFKWLIFFDMDEFIFLKNYKNIKDYLNNKKFNKCQVIHLNWVFHTDNNLLHDNRSLSMRFPEREKSIRGQKVGGILGIKSILKGNIDINITCLHKISSKLIGCDGFGNLQEIKGITTNKSDLYYYYIDHYYSKSTEEFINKLMRGSAADKNAFNKSDINPKLNRIKVYFSINEITSKKVKYIENITKLNLSLYRNKIKIDK